MEKEKIIQGSALLDQEDMQERVISHLEYWLNQDLTRGDTIQSIDAHKHVIKLIEDNWDVFDPIIVPFLRHSLENALEKAKKELEEIRAKIESL